MNKVKVLFLCTGNSCRSQMAEGWAKQLKDDVIEPYSAGVEPHGMNARAVKVMAEAGVDEQSATAALEASKWVVQSALKELAAKNA